MGKRKRAPPRHELTVLSVACPKCGAQPEQRCVNGQPCHKRLWQLSWVKRWRRLF